MNKGLWVTIMTIQIILFELPPAKPFFSFSICLSPSLPQIFIKQLLWHRYCTRSWRYKTEAGVPVAVFKGEGRGLNSLLRGLINISFCSQGTVVYPLWPSQAAASPTSAAGVLLVRTTRYPLAVFLIAVFSCFSCKSIMPPRGGWLGLPCAVELDLHSISISLPGPIQFVPHLLGDQGISCWHAGESLPSSTKQCWSLHLCCLACKSMIFSPLSSHFKYLYLKLKIYVHAFFAVEHYWCALLAGQLIGAPFFSLLIDFLGQEESLRISEICSQRTFSCLQKPLACL